MDELAFVAVNPPGRSPGAVSDNAERAGGEVAEKRHLIDDRRTFHHLNGCFAVLKDHIERWGGIGAQPLQGQRVAGEKPCNRGMVDRGGDFGHRAIRIAVCGREVDRLTAADADAAADNQGGIAEQIDCAGPDYGQVSGKVRSSAPAAAGANDINDTIILEKLTAAGADGLPSECPIGGR
jgi:hypothetical protein